MPESSLEDNPKRPSNTSVRKAGSTVRRYLRNPDPPSQEDEADLADAARVIATYRACYSAPMVRVDRILRQLCDTAGMEVQVTHRLKRLPTILGKINRPDNTDLSRMEDIGGCRVVAENVSDLWAIRRYVLNEFKDCVHRERDYVANPRATGYRAVHLIVKEPTTGLKIEIQLRTPRMHEWADLVESFNRVLSEDFKQDGTHVVQEFMKLQSKVFASKEELGPALSKPEIDKLSILKRGVQELLDSVRAAVERN